MTICPECGARATSELSCQSVFDACLVKEFVDPAFGAVHHLTVAAYMLQHSSKLSREGWLSMRQLLREFLIENKPPALVRKQNKDFVDSGKRKFKITTRDGQPLLGFISWAKTILDVRMDDAEVYCESVTAWATFTLTDAAQVNLN